MPSSFFNVETHDGIELHGQLFILKKNTRAVIYLIHGLGDHIARWAHVGELLSDSGFAFISFDLRGHGKSEGKRGHAPSFGTLFDDISLVIEKEGIYFSNIPRFIYGHSFGGNLAINYILQRNPDFCGAIITSPWLSLAFDPPKYKIRLGEFAEKIFPSLIQKTRLDPTAISRDLAVVDSYINDPLVHDKISARLFIETRKYGLYALEKAGKFPIPILLMHGTSDRITSYKASKKFAQKCGTRCEFKTWEGFFHELHNEPEKLEVISQIIEWIERKIIVSK